MNLLDLIFPKKCVNCKRFGDYLCSNCFSLLSYDVKPICAVCTKPAIYGLTHPRCLKKYEIDGVFSSVYYSAVAKKLIYNFKYKPYLSDLKKFLSELTYEALIQKEEFMRLTTNNLIFTSVPIHSSKFKKRGYNQAEVLAKELSRRFEFPYMNLLTRKVDTKSQFKLSKEERRQNVKGIFEFSSKDRELKGKTVIVMDDVVTTGATLREAAKVLKRAGAGKVYGLAFAQD